MIPKNYHTRMRTKTEQIKPTQFYSASKEPVKLERQQKTQDYHYVNRTSQIKKPVNKFNGNDSIEEQNLETQSNKQKVQKVNTPNQSMFIINNSTVNINLGDQEKIILNVNNSHINYNLNEMNNSFNTYNSMQGSNYDSNKQFKNVVFNKQESEKIMFDKYSKVGLQKLTTVKSTKSILKNSNNSSLNVSQISINQSQQSSVYLDKSIFQVETIDKITKMHKYYQLDQYKVMVDDKINQIILADYLNFIRSKQTYTDQDFKLPPLFYLPDNQKVTFERKQSKFRIYDIKISSYDLYFNNFDDLLDLKAVLIYLSQNPITLKNLLQMQLYNKQGIYYMKLYFNGYWQVVIIDDRLPVIQNNNQQYLIETYHKQRQYFWSNLIVKGIAKIVGGYNRIREYNYVQFMQMFTGCNYFLYQVTPNIPQMFLLFEKALTNNHVVYAQTLNLKERQTKQMMKLNLMPNTVYLVTNFYEFNSFKQKNRLLQIQNSQSDKLKNYRGLFTQDKVERLVKQNNDNEQEIMFQDNCFWMEMNEFKKLFCRFSMFKVDSQSYFISKQIKHLKNRFCIIQLEVTSYSVCGFQLFQKQMKQCSNPQFCDVRMIVCLKTDNQEYTYIDSILDNEQVCQMELNLTSGNYVIIIMADYHDKPIEVMLTASSTNRLSFQQLDYKLNRNVINQYIKDQVSKFGINQVVKAEHFLDSLYYRSYFSFKDGFIFEYLKNVSFTQLFKVKKQFQMKYASNYDLICEDINVDNQIDTNLEHDQDILIIVKLKQSFINRIKKELYYKQIYFMDDQDHNRKVKKMQQVYMQNHISHIYNFGMNINQL